MQVLVLTRRVFLVRSSPSLKRAVANVRDTYTNEKIKRMCVEVLPLETGEDISELLE